MNDYQLCAMNVEQLDIWNGYVNLSLLKIYGRMGNNFNMALGYVPYKQRRFL